MKSRREIAFFKGKRDYIQGADLVELAVESLPPFGKFVFVSRKVANHPTYWIEDDGVNKDVILATITVEDDSGEKTKYVAIQDTTRKISESVKFDEMRMFEQAIIDGERVSCNVENLYSIWEYISSLQKLLLTRLFGTPTWWFVRIEGDFRHADRSERIELKYIGKKRILYRSDIYINGDLCGSVDFAMRDDT
jgi:hypothetical protein